MDSIIAKPISQIRAQHYDELVKQAQAHLQLIEYIKSVVSQDIDNINHPEPFLQAG